MAFDREQFERDFDRAKAGLMAFVEHGAAAMKFMALAWLERSATPSPAAQLANERLPGDRLLKAPEAAAYVSCSIRAINEHIACGNLPHHYMGADRRVRVDDLEKWAETRSFKKKKKS
jgi:excisionase family DNA binding protein